jgi:hypothetical protein
MKSGWEKAVMIATRMRQITNHKSRHESRPDPAHRYISLNSTRKTACVKNILIDVQRYNQYQLIGVAIAAGFYA